LVGRPEAKKIVPARPSWSPSSSLLSSSLFCKVGKWDAQRVTTLEARMEVNVTTAKVENIHGNMPS